MTYAADTKAKTMSRPWVHLTMLAILATTSMFVNVRLVGKVRELKDVVAILNNEDRLGVGAPAPAINVKDLDGNRAEISFAGAEVPTVLYVFSPTCVWCAGNLDNAKYLAKGAGQRYRFYAVSLSDEKLRDYVAENGIDFSVFGGVTDDARATYKMGGTPQTLVISPDGRILKNWMGAYLPDTAREVEQYFNVHLPGLVKVKR